MAVFPAGTPDSATDFFGLAIVSEELIEFFFVGVITEEVVELVARLHVGDDVLLRAALAYRFIGLERSLVHGAKGGEGIKRDRHVRRAQLLDGEERRLPKLGDVREHRRLHG